MGKEGLRGLSVLEQTGLLEQAACVTLKRFDRDTRKLPGKFRVLVDEFRDRMFEEDFEVGKLVSAAGPGRATLFEELRFELGQSLRSYLFEARLEVAIRLLRDSDLSTTLVGHLVGYSNPDAFRSALRRWIGLAPKELRERLWKLNNGLEVDDDLLSLDVWRQLCQGDSDSEIRNNIVPWLKAFYLSPENASGSSQNSFAESLVENLVIHLVECSVGEEGELLEGLRYVSPTVIRLLWEKSVEVGRFDKGKGIRIASLVVEMLTCKELECQGRENLLVLAWAHLGHSHRLAENFNEAENYFKRAWSSRELLEIPFDREVEAEVLLLEGSLRLFQRRFIEADKMLSRAISLSRALGSRRLLVKALLQHAAVLGYAGDSEAGIPGLHEALHYANDLGDPLLRFGTFQNLASAYVLSENFSRAAEFFAKAKRLEELASHPLASVHLDIVEGLISFGVNESGAACSLLSNVRAEMLKLGKMGYVAWASLELATIHFSQGRLAEAVQFASEGVPVFETLGLKGEEEAALEILQEAVVADRLTEEILSNAARHIRWINLSPISPLNYC